LFDIGTKNTALVAVIILIGIMIFSGFALKPQFENPEVIFNEEPLEKNVKLQIFPGDEYKYKYLINDTAVNITYRLMSGSGCTIIYLQESANFTHICVDEWGMDRTKSNSTFENPSFLLFKPWMLALEDNWKWNNSMYVKYDKIYNHISDNQYRVMRRENYSGRMAFVVEISSSSGPSEYQWIDEEKRVLLKTIGEGYVVELITQ
jgi:hypothetical protein